MSPVPIFFLFQEVKEMAEEKEKMFYFQKNVLYTLGVRFYRGDPDGAVLNSAQPWVAVKESQLRDFKLANKRSFVQGLLKEIEEPDVDWETPNSISDEEVTDLVKNWLKLKSRVPTIDSLPILYKMREEAKVQDRAKRITSLIQARIDELEELQGEIVDPSEMRGVR